VTGFCEKANEVSGSSKAGDSMTTSSPFLVSPEELYFLELVN
jgi:hypothetical protein